MRVLIVGGGGREHAIAWKLSQSSLVSELHAAPGNAGIAALATCHPVASTDLAGQVALARRLRPGLVVVAPDDPLAMGLVNRLQEENITAFGPTRGAAQLEWSKAFAKQVMAEAGVPTAAWADFTDYAAARRFLARRGVPVVVKADGLALGKGVTVAHVLDTAVAALKAMMADQVFGAAGGRVVIEEYLEGQEVSVLAFSDGVHVRAMPAVQDHKRVGEGDTGPNTGGMGTYTPVPVYSPAVHEQVMARVIEPVISAMRKRGCPFKGVLFTGLILTAQGPKVLEFNARFGDPEAQVVLPLLDADLAAVMLACAEGNLDQVRLAWREAAAACVVLASAGYPGNYSKGRAISGLDQAAALGALVFHAGTARQDTEVVTAGGRVLGVVGTGADLPTAVAAAYRGADAIHFEGAFCRRDIGWRALGRGRPPGEEAP